MKDHFIIIFWYLDRCGFIEARHRLPLFSLKPESLITEMRYTGVFILISESLLASLYVQFYFQSHTLQWPIKAFLMAHLISQRARYSLCQASTNRIRIGITLWSIHPVN